MATLRRSPSNRTRIPGTSGTVGVPVTSGTVTAIVSSPYLAGKTSKEQSALAKRTAYLQPTSADLAKGQFGAATGGVTGSITLEQYQSQRTSLSATQAIGKQVGIQTAASSPAPGGKGTVTTETFAKFRQDIQLEEMFGMLGSGSAANIRLAAAQTGASIPSLIALENKTLGIRQELAPGKAAFSYSGSTYDVKGNLVGLDKARGSIQLEGPAAFGFTSSLAQEAATIASKITPSGGITNLTQVKSGIAIGSSNVKPTLSTPTSSVISSKTIETTIVAPPSTNAGAEYRSAFVKATGVDIFKPLIAPTTVKAIKDITGISEGKAPTSRLPDFMGKLTAPGELKGGKFEGVRYADLYEPTSAGSSTFKLTSAGTAFRNLQIKGTPGINLRIK